MSLEQPKSILKGKEIPTSMDFDQLKREGVDEVQKLSGRIWTDYNEHDPGVTILENLCYAITELGYKTNFSIQDLFFKKSKSGDKEFLKTFYKPSEILPPPPVTETDFRKLIIDHVKEVKNAWVKPKKQSQVGTRINGLYEVLILVNENYNDKISVQKQVEQLLIENRNLGEDFDVFRVLDYDDVYFSGNISIAPDAIGESVYANILSAIQALFSPTIPLYSKEEVLRMPDGKEMVNNHPPVKNGYVIDSDLESSSVNSISKLYISKIIKVITDVEGVEGVYDFSLFVGGEKVPTEIFQLDDYKVPFLNVDKIIDESLITLLAGDMSYNADPSVIKYTYEIEKNRKALKHKRYTEKPFEEISSNKSEEEIQEYISIQNSFPKTYGITDFGIEGHITDQRNGQVKQLRAYLYFFEQLMGNYLSQLANIDKLFSTAENLEHTYFFQQIEYINGYNDILNRTESDPEMPLSKINDKFDKTKERRNRFLDHMLARFGEEFLLEAYNAIHRESSSLAKSNFLDENIQAKIKFLNNYIEISRNKAKGINYLEDYKEPENVSGLEKKISLLFNFKEYGFKRLSDISQNKDLKISDKKTNPSKKSISFNSDEPNFLADVLAFGIERNNYRIEKEKEYVVYFENRSTRKSHLIYKAKLITEAEDAITTLMEKLKAINESSEGFHLLEHILLRDVNAAFRFIYVSEDNTEITSDFSYTDSSYSRTEFISNLLSIGTDKSNYTVNKKGDFYSFSITKKSAKFNVVSESYSSKKDAESAMKNLLEELKNTKIIDTDLEFRIHLDQDMSNVSIYDKDPYSLQISFLCPCWSGRFRSDKMKYLFENVVRLNTPAHLSVNFHWLNISEMADFEAPFEKWLHLKKENSDRKQIDQFSAYLLMLMSKFGSNEVNKDLEKQLKQAKAALKL